MVLGSSPCFLYAADFYANKELVKTKMQVFPLYLCSKTSRLLQEAVNSTLWKLKWLL